MKTRYRVVKLRNGKYAQQKRVLLWWKFTRDILWTNIIEFDKAEDARIYRDAGREIIEIVKEL